MSVGVCLRPRNTFTCAVFLHLKLELGIFRASHHVLNILIVNTLSALTLPPFCSFHPPRLAFLSPHPPPVTPGGFAHLHARWAVAASLKTQAVLCVPSCYLRGG